MAKIVKADRSQAGGPDQLGEPLGDPLGRDRGAVLAGEQQPVIVVRVAPFGSLGVLTQAVLHQCTDQERVQIDDAVLAAARLGFAEQQAAMLTAAEFARERFTVELDDLTADDRAALLEVEVVPPQPERLAATQASSGDGLEQRGQLVAGGMVEEVAEVRRVPWMGLRPRAGW